MARLFTCGYETGLVGEDGGTNTSSGSNSYGGTIATAAPSPRSGSYCMYCRSGTSTGGYGMRSLTLPGALTEHYGRLGIYIANGTGSNVEICFLQLMDSGGTNQIYLTVNYSTLILRAYRGAPFTGALIATSTNVATAGGWHLIEYRATIDDLAGVFQLWLNGTLEMDFSGDTRNAGTGNVQTLYIGEKQLTVPAGTHYIGFDDLGFNDTTDPGDGSQMGRCGDAAVLYLSASDNGTTSQLVGSDGDSADNYALVDERPPATSDYVASTATSQYDTYTLGDLSTLYNTVVLVQPLAYAALAVAGTGALRTVLRSGGADYDDAADRALTVTYQFIKGDVRYSDPSDSGGWTPAKVNALEAGPKVI